MTRPVVITGASGMLGWDTASACVSRSFHVISMGRTDPRIKGIEHWPTVLDDAAVLQKIQAARPVAIISLVAAPPSATQDVQAHVTLGSNLRLLSMAATIPDCRFIAMGSAAEYGPASHGMPLTETAMRQPVSHYGHAKARLMDAIARAAETGQDALGIRLFSLVSARAGESSLAGRVRRQLLDPRANAVSIGPLDGARDMSPAHHVAEAIVTLAILPHHLPAWLNLGCGNATGLRRFVAEMIRCSGRQLDLCEGPAPEGVMRGGTLVADTTRLAILGLEIPAYPVDALARLALGLTSSTAPAMNTMR